MCYGDECDRVEGSEDIEQKGHFADPAPRLVLRVLHGCCPDREQ